jgi:hypothetical protein
LTCPYKFDLTSVDRRIIESDDHTARKEQELGLDLQNTCRHIEILFQPMCRGAIHHQRFAELAEVVLTSKCASPGSVLLAPRPRLDEKGVNLQMYLDLDLIVSPFHLLELEHGLVRLGSLSHTRPGLLVLLIKFVTQIMLGGRGKTACGRSD